MQNGNKPLIGWHNWHMGAPVKVKVWDRVKFVCLNTVLEVVLTVKCEVGPGDTREASQLILQAPAHWWGSLSEGGDSPVFAAGWTMWPWIKICWPQWRKHSVPHFPRFSSPSQDQSRLHISREMATFWHLKQTTVEKTPLLPASPYCELLKNVGIGSS